METETKEQIIATPVKECIVCKKEVEPDKSFRCVTCNGYIHRECSEPWDTYRDRMCNNCIILNDL